MVRLIRSATERATRALALVLALTLALGPAAARADSTADAKARALYKDGMKAYDVGDFNGALALYSEAYKLTQLPGFLFNIAQCHRQLSNFEQGAFFYGRFIDTSKPKSANVELATQLLGEMTAKQAQQLAADQKKAEEDARAAEEARKAEEARRASDLPRVTMLVPTQMDLPPPPPPPLAEEPPVYRKWWFWTLIGVGVGVAAVATGTAIAASAPTVQPTTQPPIGMPH
jgi:tetratricopeptide (TPR) repeat protein